ncbi:MAG: hypothetical protein V1837_05695 [Candidatus Woesearchaeota archaeon]
MSSFEIHEKKYLLFRKDAENSDNSPMTRINSYFEASFHAIESCAVLFGIHINKHQDVRRVLEQNKVIFGQETMSVWSKFQDLENKVRPGQLYGGKINGENLQKAKELAAFIFEICEKTVKDFRKKNITKSSKMGFSQEKYHENAEGI